MLDKKIDKKIYKIVTCPGFGSYDGYRKYVQRHYGDIDSKYNGDTIFHLILKSSFAEYATHSYKITDTFKELVKIGFDSNMKNDEGKTFIHSAIEDENIDVFFVNDILRCKTALNFDVTNVDNDNKTIFHYMAERIDEEIYYDYFLLNFSSHTIGKHKTAINIKDKNNNAVSDIIKQKYDNYNRGHSEKNKDYKYSWLLYNLSLVNFQDYCEKLYESKNIADEIKYFNIAEIVRLMVNIIESYDEAKSFSIIKRIIEEIKENDEFEYFIAEEWIGHVKKSFSRRSVDYTIKLINLYLENGVVLNSETANELFKYVYNEKKLFNDELLKVYLFLSGYGCDNNNLKTTKIRNQGLSILFEKELKEKIPNLSNVDVSDIEFINLLLEIKTSFIDFDKQYTDQQLICMIIEKINDMLDECIVCNKNVVTNATILKITKELVIKSLDDKIEKVLVKK